MLRNKPALVHEAFSYMASKGVSTSGYKHITLLYETCDTSTSVLECTQSVLYTIQPEKPGYGHE